MDTFGFWEPHQQIRVGANRGASGIDGQVSAAVGFARGLGDATTIVLGRGVWGRLQVRPQTLARLAQAGATVHVLKTKEAVRLYNELRYREPVGGLFHTTC